MSEVSNSGWEAKKEELLSSFAVVLVMLVAIYFLSEAFVFERWLSVVLSALAYAATLISFRAIGSPIHRRHPLAWAMAAAFASTVVFSITGAEPFRIPGEILVGLLAVTVFVRLLAWVLTRRWADSNVVFASICVYLLLGLVFGFIYTQIASLEPEAFEPPQFVQDTRDSALFYYSLVTVSTLGFGDIVPVATAVRGLTVLEAVFGQIYLVVLVARLVGMHIGRRQARASVQEIREILQEALGDRPTPV